VDGEQITSVIAAANLYSVDLTVFDEAFLDKAIKSRLIITGIHDAEAYSEYIKDCSLEAEAFFNSLQVSYSRFFREPLSFAILEQIIIPNIVRNAHKGSEIRIWSTGCASGQEAYSIAMLLCEQLELARSDLRFRIFATDISSNALGAAKEGVYSENDISNVRHRFVKTYFHVINERFTIVPKLKKGVCFSHFDLINSVSNYPPESIFGDFDIVLCSNLLMYYKPKIRLSIIDKLENAISDTGFLVVGGAERSFVMNNTTLQIFSTPAAIFQRSTFSQKS
jgi:chemotaxis methyl-accepting protein methylase